MKKYVAIFVIIAAVVMGMGFFDMYRSAIKSFWSQNDPAPYALTGWETTASEWTALTAALYWEGHLDESEDGLVAIAWTIKNRVMSRHFPNTIRGVVTHGFEIGRRTGCQYSFVCNGAGESPTEYVRLMNRMGVHLTAAQAEKRWREYSAIAARFLEDPGQDITRGANHYWATSMGNPYWISDIEPDSIIKIGSHTFGWSRKKGSDVPRILNWWEKLFQARNMSVEEESSALF